MFRTLLPLAVIPRPLIEVLVIAGITAVPLNVGEADNTALPVPVTGYSPSTPALSKRTRVVVPPATTVVPDVIVPAEALIVQVEPRVQV